MSPCRLLVVNRDDVAIRANIFPDAELCRQALELLIADRGGRAAPDPAPDRPVAPEGVCVIDDGDCEACQ